MKKSEEQLFISLDFTLYQWSLIYQGASILQFVISQIEGFQEGEHAQEMETIISNLESFLTSFGEDKFAEFKAGTDEMKSAFKIIKSDD